MRRWLWAVLTLTIPAWPQDKGVEWALPALPYRILVEVPAVDIGRRQADSLVASLDLDFAALGLPGPVDTDSLQVIRYDQRTGRKMPAPQWPFRRSDSERASRFLDRSLPWDFPVFSFRNLFPRGAFLVNAYGRENPGLLVWDHSQDGREPSYYAVYLDTRKSGARWTPPRQGFLGDGSPRRDPAASLTGSWYNRVTVDDWDGDGLEDILVGVGTGSILLYRNAGDRQRPRYERGEYLRDGDGRILVAGGMPTPAIVDWNGDGVKDLLVGVEGGKVAYYQNAGSNTERKLVLRGLLQADGKELEIPAKPCPESPHYQHDYAPTVEPVDWDGDGDTDLLLGGYITGYVWFYENVGRNADGTPVLKFRGPLEADGKPLDTVWGAAPSAVDLDGDGDLDLITGSFGQRMGGGDAFSHFLLYYENIGTRRQPKLTKRRVEYEDEEPHDILATPRPLATKHDGLTDLVISTMGEVYLARNVGTKQSPKWKPEKFSSTWGLAPLSATQLIDIDGDGRLDIVSAPLDGDSVPSVRLNQGGGTHGLFTEPRPMLPAGQEIRHPQPYGDPWAFVYLYDFDGDGVLDILWADAPGHVYLHHNGGTNRSPAYDTRGERLVTTDGKSIKVGPPVVSLNEIPDFTVMQGSRATLAAADFNRDGASDLVVGDAYGDVYYFENAGTNQKPAFVPGVRVSHVGARAVPLTYDVDGDRWPDIVVAAWSGEMEWCRNGGSGANARFEKPRKLDLPPTVAYSPRVVIADWNGDGDDDFLMMSSYPWFCWVDGSYVKHGYIPGRRLMVESKR